jgi:hypothetical protein
MSCSCKCLEQSVAVLCTGIWPAMYDSSAVAKFSQDALSWILGVGM